MNNAATELESYFNSTKLPSHPVKLNPHTTVGDVKKCINGHLELVKNNSENPVFRPYLTRLQELKQYIESYNSIDF